MREVRSQTETTPAHPLEGAQGLVGPAIEKMEADLDEVVRSTVEMIPEVSRHLLGAGGKRIRPTLLLLVAEAAGADPLGGVNLAVAAELIHNATLLHDDVVDRGHLRRGVAAAPQVYGNSASVLVGDFMMAQAFRLVVGHGDLALLRELSRVVSAMAEGEMLQLVRSGRVTLSLPNYEEIISGKTAGLFSWACRAGAALVAGDAGTRQRTEAAAAFGRAFGMAFQVTDDILDYTAAPEESGKDLANDLQQGKMTLPLLLACDDDPALLGLVEALAAKEPTHPECLALVERVLATSAIRRSRDRAREYAEDASAHLAAFADGEAADVLAALAEYVVARVVIPS